MEFNSSVDYNPPKLMAYFRNNHKDTVIKNDIRETKILVKKKKLFSNVH